MNELTNYSLSNFECTKLRMSKGLMRLIFGWAPVMESPVQEIRVFQFGLWSPFPLTVGAVYEGYLLGDLPGFARGPRSDNS
jgi:hypothetical protein